MKHEMLAVSTIVVLLAGLLMVAAPAGADGPSQRYVAVFNGNKMPEKVAQLVADAGGELVKTFGEIGVGIAISSDPAFAASLKGARSVHSVGLERVHALPATEAYAAEDAPMPADAHYYAYQWGIRRVNADLAWEITSGSHDTVVAILDTGIASNHPDLAPNLVYATCYSTAPTCSAYPDLHWHGTHVAGIVAAAFGGGAAVGVGPNLGLASYNVFERYIDPYRGPVVVAFDEVIWEAMLDAADQGFDVVNMSLGGYIIRSASPEDVAVWTAWNRVADYVTKQGVTIVAASGNGNTDLNGPVDHIPSDVTGIISVGGTGIGPDPFYPQEGAYDVRASYSNYGAAVTLAAPGGDYGPDDSTYPYRWYLVLSDYVIPKPACAATASCPVRYAWVGGTSMASAHVAGAAGLVKDLNPGLNPHQVSKILKQTAESSGDRQQFGHGMLDVDAAVRK